MLLLSTLAFALQAPPAPVTPRLVVLVSVDQLRPDQLQRLSPVLEGGLGRMLEGGLVFREASLAYAASETGPGHATLGSGCIPRTHGVTGNGIWLTEEQREIYCYGDDEARAVTSRGVEDTPAGRGPRNQQVPGLGEHLRARHPGAKVVSISGKDRGAIGLAGRKANAVLWWDKGDGGFASTTAYGDALPDWALRWNTEWLTVCSGWRWEPLLTTGLEELGTAADDREGESVRGPFGRGFPYTLPTVEDPADRGQLGALATLVYSSALVDECVARLARASVIAEGLGDDDEPDVLALAFSACDTVGHANGPFSHEVTDVVLRLDRELGALFELLDERVGADRWTVALSADHGVLPLPEHLAGQAIGGRRVGAGELRHTREAVRRAMEARFGHRVEKSFNAGGITLDRDKARELGVDLVEARRVARDAAEASIAQGGWLAAAYTYDELAAGGPDEDPWRARFVQGFYPGRSKDVVFRRAPWTLVGWAVGTSHGSCYPYDTRIPLVFYGAGVPAGRRSDAAGSEDAVPTLLGILGVAPLGELDGRDLLLEPRVR